MLDKVRDWSLSNNKQQVPYLATEITGALSSIKLVKSRPRVRPEIAIREKKPFAVVRLQLDGNKSFSYPTKAINTNKIIYPYGPTIWEVDESAKSSVDETAQNYITTFLARLSASLLRFYRAQDMSQPSTSRIAFPSGEASASYSPGHSAAVASYQLRLKAEEPSLVIAEEMRGLFGWDRLHVDVDLITELPLAEVVEHFKTRSWKVAEFVPNDYAAVDVGSLGANSRPAKITVAKREGSPKQLRITFLLDTISKEHDIRALTENIAVILGV